MAKPQQTWSKLSPGYRAQLRAKGVERGLTEKQVRDRYNRGTLTRGFERERSGRGSDEYNSFQKAQRASYLQQKLDRGEELSDAEQADYDEGKEYWYHLCNY